MDSESTAGVSCSVTLFSICGEDGRSEKVKVKEMR
jgi:hypothetical protein